MRVGSTTPENPRLQSLAAAPRAGSRRVVLFPLALIVAVAPIPGASVLTRVLMVLALVPFSVATWSRLSRVEFAWFRLCAAYFLGLTASALLVLYEDSLPPEFRESIPADLGKQFFLLALAVCAVLVLRSDRARVALGRGLGWAGVVYAGVILAAYLSFAGVGVVQLGELAAFKFYADQVLGLALNPLSFAMLLSMAIAVPYWRFRGWKLLGFLGLGAAATLVSGSRTTQMTLLASLAIVGMWRVMLKLPRNVRGPCYGLACMFVVGGLALAPVGNSVDLYEASRVTTGRIDLWIAALSKFAMKPLGGWGAGSWKVELYSFLPEYTQYGSEAFLEGLGSGGFHNAYLTVLAERGILAFVPGMMMLWKLARWSRTLFKHRSVLPSNQARFAAVAPVFVLMLALRGLGEQPGLFGNADGLVDFIAYACAAQIVASYAALRRAQAPQKQLTAQNCAEVASPRVLAGSGGAR